MYLAQLIVIYYLAIGALFTVFVYVVGRGKDYHDKVSPDAYMRSLLSIAVTWPQGLSEIAISVWRQWRNNGTE